MSNVSVYCCVQACRRVMKTDSYNMSTITPKSYRCMQQFICGRIHCSLNLSNTSISFIFLDILKKTHEHENFETKDKAAGQVVTRSTLIYVRFVHDDVYSFPITRQTHERMRLEILTFFVSLLDCFLKVLHMMI